MSKVSNFRKDLTGLRFGQLYVVKFAEEKLPRVAGRWLCRCDCGTEKFIFGSELTRSSEKTISCGCFGKNRRGNARRYVDRSIPAINAALNVAIQSARRRNHAFCLSREEWLALVTKPCYYCGCEKSNTYSRGSSVFRYNGIDRLDSNFGYTPENCVPCCKICNLAKRSLSEHDFLEKIKKIYEFRNLANA